MEKKFLTYDQQIEKLQSEKQSHEPPALLVVCCWPYWANVTFPPKGGPANRYLISFPPKGGSVNRLLLLVAA